MRRLIEAFAAAAILAVAVTAGAAQSVPLGSPIPQKPLGQALDGTEATAFAANQLTFARVADARKAREGELRLLFQDRGIPYPAPEIFLRVFKHERVLELWVRSRGDAEFTLLKEYPVCALPGQLGPKQRMGDIQVPEGFYFIDDFNPRSAYHLSLRVNYPNLADRMRREALALGGDIFIHGGCETIGCVPIENDNIEEVYWLAVQAMDAGQKIIPVHIFPTRLDPMRLEWLRHTFQPEPRLLGFWHNLAQGYEFFEQTRQVPWVTVAESGEYRVPERPRLADAAPADAAPADAAPAEAAPPEPAPSGAAQSEAGRSEAAQSKVIGAPAPAGRALPKPQAVPVPADSISAPSPAPSDSAPVSPPMPSDSSSGPPPAPSDSTPAPPPVPPDSVLPRGPVKPDSVRTPADSVRLPGRPVGGVPPDSSRGAG